MCSDLNRSRRTQHPPALLELFVNRLIILKARLPPPLPTHAGYIAYLWPGKISTTHMRRHLAGEWTLGPPPPTLFSCSISMTKWSVTLVMPSVTVTMWSVADWKPISNHNGLIILCVRALSHRGRRGSNAFISLVAEARLSRRSCCIRLLHLLFLGVGLCSQTLI